MTYKKVLVDFVLLLAQVTLYVLYFLRLIEARSILTLCITGDFMTSTFMFVYFIQLCLSFVLLIKNKSIMVALITNIKFKKLIFSTLKVFEPFQRENVKKGENQRFYSNL